MPRTDNSSRSNGIANQLCHAQRPNAALALRRSPAAHSRYMYTRHVPRRAARARPRLGSVGSGLFDLLEDGLAAHPLRHHTHTLLHRRPWMLRKAPAAASATAHPAHHAKANTAAAAAAAAAAAVEEGGGVIVAREVSFACEFPLLVAALALLVGLSFCEPTLPGLVTDAAGALRAALHSNNSSHSSSHSSTMQSVVVFGLGTSTYEWSVYVTCVCVCTLST
eukprot:COSAG06_NODE_2366_length_7002_cov_11.463277_12_plen_222_part_00